MRPPTTCRRRKDAKDAMAPSDRVDKRREHPRGRALAASRGPRGSALLSRSPLRSANSGLKDAVAEPGQRHSGRSSWHPYPRFPSPRCCSAKIGQSWRSSSDREDSAVWMERSIWIEIDATTAAGKNRSTNKSKPLVRVALSRAGFRGARRAVTYSRGAGYGRGEGRRRTLSGRRRGRFKILRLRAHQPAAFGAPVEHLHEAADRINRTRRSVAATPSAVATDAPRPVRGPRRLQ